MELPFYAWECITLELSNGRTIDLVIKNEDDMMKFIKYLIFKLDLYNNWKGLSTKVQETLSK